MASVGGKGANLGELTSAGLAGPPGVRGHRRRLPPGAGRGGACGRARRGSAGVDVDDPAALAQAAGDCSASVRDAGMPDAVRRAVLDAYRRARRRRTGGRAVVGDGRGHGVDLVRRHERDVHQRRGDPTLLDRIVDCWASLCSPRVIAYRASAGSPTSPPSPSWSSAWSTPTRAGVMFTADPATGDRDRIVIEAAFGLGEVVVSGQVEPDTYVARQGRAPRPGERIGHQGPQDRAAAEAHDRRGAVPRGRAGDGACSTTTTLMALAHSACGSSATTATRRTSSGRSATTTSDRAVAADHHPGAASRRHRRSSGRARCCSGARRSRRASPRAGAHPPLAHRGPDCSPARSWWRR